MMVWNSRPMQFTLDSSALEIVPSLGTSPLPFFPSRSTAFDLWAHTICSVCRGPDSSWDYPRASHKSLPNELDRYVPSDRGTGLPLMHHEIRNVRPSGPFWASSIGLRCGLRASTSLVQASIRVLKLLGLVHFKHQEISLFD